MESHPQAPKLHPKLDTLGMVLMVLAIVIGVGGFALRLVYGFRFPFYIVVIGLMAAGGAVRSHAVVGGRMAWATTAFSVLLVLVLVLAELFIAD
jgi:hypothetical protein